MGRRARPRIRRRTGWRVTRATAALLAACLTGSGLGAVWQPRPASAETIRELSWYLDAMRVADAHEITRGDGVTVAVVDTGVDSGHPDLQGQVLDGGEVGDEDEVDPAGDGRDDRDGHGTGMASLIAGKGDGANSVLGVAPESKILPVRIAQTSDGSFQPADVYKGVRWAIDHGAEVVNMSLGGEPSTDAPWKKQLIDYATEKDVVLIAAAGNTGEGDKRVSEPASIPGVVAVSGVTQDGTFWKGSARGPEVVVSAPAEELPMAAPRSVSASGYVLADGTSGATALVSGVAALIRAAFPDISANDVVNRLIRTAEDRGEAGRDDQYGYGVVDALAALEGDVPGAAHNPLVSPEAEKSSAAAAGDSRRTGDAALIVVGVFAGTVLVLLFGGYLISLVRRSRQVVVAGMAPGVAAMPVGAGALWRPPGAVPVAPAGYASVPPSGHVPGYHPPPGYLPGYVPGAPPGYPPPGHPHAGHAPSGYPPPGHPHAGHAPSGYPPPGHSHPGQPHPGHPGGYPAGPPRPPGNPVPAQQQGWEASPEAVSWPTAPAPPIPGQPSWPGRGAAPVPGAGRSPGAVTQQLPVVPPPNE